MLLEKLGHKVWRLTQIIGDWQAIRIYQQGYDIDLYLKLSQSKLLEKININTVIDIGAYKGKWSYIVNLLRPQATIFAFEPAREQINRLNQLSFINKVFPVALGAAREMRPFYVNAKPQSSSLFHLGKDTNRFFSSLSESEELLVQVEKLDSLLATEQLKDGILVKMDVQGAEADVINGGKDILSRSRAVIVEINYAMFYEGQPTFSQICHKLNDLGFEYFGALNEHRDQETKLVIFEDALFVRGNLW
jgi:FkbM family methyltransferase